MAFAKSIPTWLRQLAQPHPSVTDEVLRRRTKLILAICLIGIPVEIVDMMTSWLYEPKVGLNVVAVYAISALSMATTIATYLVARSRHAKWSFSLFCALISGIGWLYVYQGAGTPFHDALLSYADFAIVLTALFGGPLLISIITLANVAMVFLEPASHGPEFYARVTFASTYLLTGGFLIIGAVMRSNDTKTIRQRTLEAEQGEARFRVLADSAMEGIVVHDEGVILDANAAASRLLGYPRTEYIGMRVLDITTPASRKLVEQVIRDNPEATVEVDAVRKDGSTIRVESRGRPLPYNGHMARVSSFRDVSLEHETRARLEQARKEAQAASDSKSNFLATVSHELRSPLNAVLGYAQLLEDANLEEKEKDMLRTMRLASEHLLSMVSNILDFTKSETGGITLNPKPSELASELRAVVTQHEAEAKAKGLRLEVFLPDPPAPLVLTDGARIRQVLDALLGNAVKFTQRGQVDVQLAWEPRDADVLATYTVRDTGHGISADLLPHLFDPFTQADSTMTRPSGGMGMGLAVSRRIAIAMGGDLRVSSQVGSGTVTSFSLRARMHQMPKAPATPATAAAPQPLDADQNGILVAEDDPVNQKVIARMLEKLGHNASLVPDGRQAVEAVSNHTFGLVLMDLHMPTMDGLEATRKIRASGNRVRIVALTADALVGDREKCLAAGMDDYLAKPVRLEELKRVLDGLGAA